MQDSGIKTLGTTALMVTHNQQEAFAVADEIGVIDQGALLQWDAAYNLYHRPADDLVADIVGEGVLIPGRVLDDRRVETGLGILEGQFHYPCSDGCRADVLIRPEDIIRDDASSFKARILKKAIQGCQHTVHTPAAAQRCGHGPGTHHLPARSRSIYRHQCAG